MPFIQVSSAGGADIPDGVYPVILTDIRGPKTVTAQRGPNAGQDVDLLDWIFNVDQPGSPVDGLEISASTSTASGPRSKMYSYLTALLNGVAPAIGTGFEKPQLVGRRALATIQKDVDGWARIVNLGAMPVTQQQQQFAQATGTPVQPQGAPAPASAVSQPLREAVAAGAALSTPDAGREPNLPF